MMRWLLYPVLFVLWLLVLIVVAGYTLLRSDKGTAWVLEQVPGLTVEQGAGSLLGQWQAEELRWQGYGVWLDMAQVRLDWSPTCLLRLSFCLEQLHVARTDLRLEPQDAPTPSEPTAISLPAIRLPVTVAISDVNLGPFTLDGTPVWDELQLVTTARESQITIEQIHYRLDEVQINARGHVDMRRDWPLVLDVDVNLPPPEGDHWLLGLALRGSVRDLRLRGDSEGYLDAHLHGTLKPLVPALPLSLRVTSDSFRPSSDLPEPVRFLDLDVNLVGSLDQGLTLQATADLPTEQGRMPLAINGLLTTVGLQGADITLRAPYHDPSARFQFAGSVDWQSGLAADAEVQMIAFPWYHLVPELPDLPVTIETLDLEGQYRDGDYRAQLFVALVGPLGESRLDTALEGDLTAISLSSLRLETGAGGLTGDAELAFGDELQWDASLHLAALNAGFWVAGLESSLSGAVSTTGRLPQGGEPELVADWHLRGLWRELSLETRGQLDGAAGQWRVEPLLVQLGDNRVEGRGKLADGIEAALRFDVPAPEQLLPELTGYLSGTVELGGTLEEPVGTLALDGDQIAWQTLASVDVLRLRANLREALSLNSSLTLSGATVAEQAVGQLAVTLDGTLESHQLFLALSNDQVNLDLGLRGGWADGWLGDLFQGEVVAEGLQWLLDRPATLAFRPEPQHLTLSAHCWRWQDSSLCAADQQFLPDPRIRYTLKQFPVAVFAGLMPEEIAWDALIDGELALDITEQGPVGHILLGTSVGELKLVALEEWQTFSYEGLSLALQLAPSEARLGLRFVSEMLGDLQLDLAIDPKDEQLPIDGAFLLDGLDLAVVGRFVDLREIEGELVGQGTLQGPLMRPEVLGEIRLRDAKILDPTIPVPLSELQLTLALLGYRAELDGSWVSNTHGRGRLQGELSWEDGVEVGLNVSGERLPVAYEPFAQLEVRPNVTIRFRDGVLDISGRAEVPRGSIEVRKLPEQAVSVSDDEVIVGVEVGEPVVTTLNMDLTVVVGDERVTFRGFGVSGDLEGTLRLGNEMDARGALQLVNGSYRAYGQELELRRARLVFVGPVAEPYLDIEAIRRVDTVTAGIRLTGPASAPETAIFSEPVMPDSDALAYLILGRPLRTTGEQGQMGEAALALGLAQASSVTRELGEEVGIRDLRLEAEGSGEDTAVVASGYITRDLSLRYGVGVFQPVTTIALRYDLGRYFYLEAASGLAASLDLFYTRDF